MTFNNWDIRSSRCLFLHSMRTPAWLTPAIGVSHAGNYAIRINGYFDTYAVRIGYPHSTVQIFTGRGARRRATAPTFNSVFTFMSLSSFTITFACQTLPFCPDHLGATTFQGHMNGITRIVSIKISAQDFVLIIEHCWAVFYPRVQGIAASITFCSQDRLCALLYGGTHAADISWIVGRLSANFRPH